MRKLSFYILGIILLFAIILLATPYFIGSQIESYTKKRLDTFQAKHPAMSIKVEKYARHWFSSDATFDVKYRIPFILSGLASSRPIDITLTAHIDHGPLVSFVLNGKKHHELAKAAIILTGTPSEMQGDIIAIFNWQHHIKAFLNISNLNLKSNGFGLVADGISGSIDHGFKPASVNYDINEKHLTMNHKLGNALDKVEIAFADHKGHYTQVDKAWTGQAQSEQQSYSLIRNGESVFSAKHMNSNINSKLVNDRMNVGINLSCADATFAGQQLGPISLDLNFNKLYPPAVDKLISNSHNLLLSNTFSLSSMLTVYSPVLTIIEKGAAFNLKNLKIQLPNKQAITANVALNFATHPKGFSIFKLTQLMTAHGNLSIPRTFLREQLTGFFEDMSNHNSQQSAPERAKAAVQKWIDNKMLIAGTNNELNTIFELKDSHLLVNGVPANFSLVGNNKKVISTSKENRYNTKSKNKG